MDRGVLDDIIRRLLEGKGGKQVQLSEGEIRQLCVNARQIFLSQPNLLELSAPIRICGIRPSLFFPFLAYEGLCVMKHLNCFVVLHQSSLNVFSCDAFADCVK